MEKKTWNTNDLDFDDQGRMIIKNVELAQRILARVNPSDFLPVLIDKPVMTIILGPTGSGSGTPHPDPPDALCDCGLAGGFPRNSPI